MTKTQIQVPEGVFRELRAFARRRDWSLAETFRRGAELLLQVYPSDAGGGTEEPEPLGDEHLCCALVGWKAMINQLQSGSLKLQNV